MADSKLGFLWILYHVFVKFACLFTVYITVLHTLKLHSITVETLNFSNLQLTPIRSSSHTLSWTLQFYPDFSSYSIFQTNFSFPWRFEKLDSNEDTFVINFFTNLIWDACLHGFAYTIFEDETPMLNIVCISVYKNR